MRTILVVDDEASFREILEFNLKEAGYNVITAANGVEALERVRRDRPDLVLLDGLLPKMHGFDVCKEIKADPAVRGTIIIIMTAVYKKIQYKYEVKEQFGADDFITKPFDLKDVMAMIGRHLPSEQG
jgi:two-component system alkaline phosphatase synthesis response regulator PhoP